MRKLRQDTFYRERSGGRWVYFAYSDGRTVYLNAPWAERQVAKGTARLVTA